MSPVTQQVNTEIKKPRMYVSFWWILLWGTSAAMAMIIGGQASNKIHTVISANLGSAFSMMYLSLFLIIILMLGFVITSLIKKPKGYIHIKFIDSLLVISCILDISFPFLIPRLSVIPLPTWMFLYFVIPFIVLVSLAVYINHKFQKSESELNMNIV